MDIETMLERLGWLTKNIVGIVAFFVISILFSWYHHITFNHGGQLEVLLSPVLYSFSSTMTIIFWSITVTLFYFYMIRKFIFGI